jgi:hypothetical protein
LAFPIGDALGPLKQKPAPNREEIAAIADFCRKFLHLR